MSDANTHFGFVSVLGLPNVGKSSLVNALCGSRICIVAPKPQTTRTNIRGIFVHRKSQIVLVDTPGLVYSGERLHKAMHQAAINSVQDSDMALFIIDASKKGQVKTNFQRLAELKSRVSERSFKTALVLNKIDKIAYRDLLPLSADLNNQFSFDATFMVSATREKGLEDLKDYLSQNVPQGPWHYDEDDITDFPVKLMAAEFTREQVFRHLKEEVPHKTTVETEKMEENADGSLTLYQSVIVQRDTQKPIVIGEKGRMIKFIGEKARKNLEEVFERRVHLKLNVRVNAGWDSSNEYYRIWGLEQ